MQFSLIDDSLYIRRRTRPMIKLANKYTFAHHHHRRHRRQRINEIFEAEENTLRKLVPPFHSILATF